MRRHTKRHMRTGVIVVLLGTLMGAAVVMLSITCERVWAQEPVKPVLSEVEKLKLVNTYQAAVLAQVDFQTAQQRLARSRDNYNTLVDKLRADHKWPASTTFEINGETGDVLVHLPPADAKPKRSTQDNKPNQGKEN